MKKHIVCFGDSNTHGYFPVEGGLGRFNESERWPCLLQKHLGEDYLVIEEGLSGRHQPALRILWKRGFAD